jgi:hypothetical protein
MNKIYEKDLLDEFIEGKVVSMCKLIVLQACGNCETFKNVNTDDVKSLNCDCKYDKCIKKFVEVIKLVKNEE